MMMPSLKRYISLLVIPLLFSMGTGIGYGTENLAAFTDIASDNPHFQAIEYLHQKGILEGYADNRFLPERTVNRAEAVKVVLLGAEVYIPPIETQEIFPDVLSDTWYAPYVLKAKNLEVVRGDGDTGLFRPGDTVNLAEMLKMMLVASGIQPDPVKRDPYPDVPQDAWFAPYFAYAKSHDLLDLPPAKQGVQPAKAIDRQTVAELIYRLNVTPKGKINTYASFYADFFQGRGTASGEKYDQNKFTAAHRTYPFGTYLRVTNVENGESVVVKVNDRGPYAGKNRVLDLSKAAFLQIASKGAGVIAVSIEELPPEEYPTSDEVNTEIFQSDVLGGSTTCSVNKATTASIKSFENIQLDQPIPGTFLANQILTVSGKATIKADQVTAFLIDDDARQTAFESEADKDGAFSVRLNFPHEGHFRLGVVPGNEGESFVSDLTILASSCLKESIDSKMPALSRVAVELEKGNTVVRWSADDYSLFKVTFRQGETLKSYLLKKLTDFVPPYVDFKNFKEGPVALIVRGAHFAPDQTLGIDVVQWGQPVVKEFQATRHYQYMVNPSKINVTSVSPFSAVRSPIDATFQPVVDLQSEAAVIAPDGPITFLTVKSSSVQPKTNEKSLSFFPAGNYPLSLHYEVTEVGTHFLEINDTVGLAALNIPLYGKNQYPLLPDLEDLSERVIKDLGNDLAALQNKFLAAVNQDREQNGMAPVVLEKNLSDLAQARAEDMVAKDYFGHYDAKGIGAEELKSKYGVKTQLSENLAQEVSIELAEYGLMRSAIHRNNILSPDWARLGIGIKKKVDGTYIFVQLFAPNPIDLSNIDALRKQVLDAVNAKRTTPLALSANLTSLSQSWSQSMADQDFFAWTDSKGNSLMTQARKTEPKKALGAFILANSSFQDGVEQLLKNGQIFEDHWRSIGIGIAQDNVGIVKMTVVYTD